MLTNVSLKKCSCAHDTFLFLLPVALLSATTVNYALSLVSLVMFYVYYTHTEGCTENKVFISVNMLLCVGASVMSILPKIQVTDSH